MHLIFLTLHSEVEKIMRTLADVEDQEVCSCIHTMNKPFVTPAHLLVKSTQKYDGPVPSTNPKERLLLHLQF
jgi:hypothetical protein